MRPQWLACLVGLAFVLLLLPVRAADDAKPLTVELKAFSFKVPEGKEELVGYNTDDDKLFLYINGTAEAKIDVPADGDYEIVVKASGTEGLNEKAKFKVSVDGKAVGKETDAAVDEPTEYKFATPLKAGQRKVAIEFTNDKYKENEYDRNLFVHAVTLKKK